MYETTLWELLQNGCHTRVHHELALLTINLSKQAIVTITPEQYAILQSRKNNHKYARCFREKYPPEVEAEVNKDDTSSTEE